MYCDPLAAQNPWGQSKHCWLWKAQPEHQKRAMLEGCRHTAWGKVVCHLRLVSLWHTHPLVALWIPCELGTSQILFRRSNKDHICRVLQEALLYTLSLKEDGPLIYFAVIDVDVHKWGCVVFSWCNLSVEKWSTVRETSH